MFRDCEDWKPKPLMRLDGKFEIIVACFLNPEEVKSVVSLRIFLGWWWWLLKQHNIPLHMIVWWMHQNKDPNGDSSVFFCFPHEVLIFHLPVSLSGLHISNLAKWGVLLFPFLLVTMAICGVGYSLLKIILSLDLVSKCFWYLFLDYVENEIWYFWHHFQSLYANALKNICKKRIKILLCIRDEIASKFNIKYFSKGWVLLNEENLFSRNQL